MYIFGGILELTKELNDLVVFDFSTMKFCQVEERPEYGDGSPGNRTGMQQESYGDTGSPTRTQKGGSPTRSNKFARSPTLRSPTKTLKLASSPDKTQRTNDGGAARGEKLGSPTSITMMNTFIIKNADSSFDQYH